MKLDSANPRHKYKCSNCQKECAPALHEVGIVSDCCGEAGVVLIADEHYRALYYSEERDLLEQLWSEADGEMSPAQKRAVAWGNRS